MLLANFSQFILFFDHNRGGIILEAEKRFDPFRGIIFEGVLLERGYIRGCTVHIRVYAPVHKHRWQKTGLRTPTRLKVHEIWSSLDLKTECKKILIYRCQFVSIFYYNLFSLLQHIASILCLLQAHFHDCDRFLRSLIPKILGFLKKIPNKCSIPKCSNRNKFNHDFVGIYSEILFYEF